MKQNIPSDKFTAIRNRNADVFKQTMRVTRSGRMQNGIDIISVNRAMTGGSVMYDKPLNANDIGDCGAATAISTINRDCLLVAADLVKLNPLLLNQIRLESTKIE